MAEITRRPSVPVDVGGVWIGGNHSIAVQSMTNTDTADITATVKQAEALALAGSELVRITVNTREAARAVYEIVARLRDRHITVPIIGDFHYNGHILLREYPDCARALNKYRINARSVEPKDSRAVIMEAMVRSAIDSAEMAKTYGMPHERVILSAKVSGVQDLIDVYRELARRSDCALHLGLTEAGMGRGGIVASTAALAVLLQEGIGDTIRVSLTPALGGDRTEEVRTCQDILQSLGIRSFSPRVTACPGCGRTTSTLFQEMAD